MTAKNARLVLKTTKTAKATLEQAAAIIGTTLSAFMIDCAMAKARDVIAQSDLIHLNRNENERLVSTLQHPSKANEKLKQLFTNFHHSSPHSTKL